VDVSRLSSADRILNTASTTLAHAKTVNAIVTLAVGESHLSAWRRFCEPGWREYARRQGFQLICLEQPLDTSERATARSPAWQKCLVASQSFAAKYEQIAWVDSDILINGETSPSIFAGVSLDKVGAVEAWYGRIPELREQIITRRNEELPSTNKMLDNNAPADYYARYGLPPLFDLVVQTGVLVFSPAAHRAVFEKTYYEYEERGGREWNFEMRPLSYELLKADLVHWIDHRFNAVWKNIKCLHYPFLTFRHKSSFVLHVQKRLSRELGFHYRKRLARHCATAAFQNNYFLHFAGAFHEIGLVEQSSRCRGA
jgi:hypothetical protein